MGRPKSLRWTTHIYNKLGIESLRQSKTSTILRSHSGRSWQSYIVVPVSSSSEKLQSNSSDIVFIVFSLP